MKSFKIDNEPKIESGFKIPDHYFENFSIKMMEQIPASEPKVISVFYKRKSLLLRVAAVFILALLIPISDKTDSNSDKLDSNALESYITYQSNVNQYDLLNILETEDIKSLKTSIVLEDETIEYILSTNSNLENFILE